MTTKVQMYSLKKPSDWFWRTAYTQEQVLECFESEGIADDWLICPLGEANKAITVEMFYSNPAIFEPQQPSPASEDESQAESVFNERDHFIMLIVGFAFLDFLALPIIASGNNIRTGELIAAVVSGSIFAQIQLVGAWGVLSAENILRRLGIIAGVGLLLYGSFGFGVIGISGGDPDVIKAVFLALPICPTILFATQAPLWGVRTWFRYELAKGVQPTRGSYLQSFGIRDFMIATAAIAIALTMVRASLPLLLIRPEQEMFLTVFAFSSLGAFVFSLLTSVPLVFITLHFQRRRSIVIGIAVWFATFLAGLTLFVSFLSGRLEWHESNLCLFATGSFTIAMCVGLLIARRHGYRLRRCEN